MKILDKKCKNHFSQILIISLKRDPDSEQKTFLQHLTKLIFEAARKKWNFDFRPQNFDFLEDDFYRNPHLFWKFAQLSRGCNFWSNFQNHVQSISYECRDIELSFDIKNMSVCWKLTSLEQISQSFSIFFHFTRVCAYVGTLRMVLPGDRLPEVVTFAIVVGIA